MIAGRVCRDCGADARGADVMPSHSPGVIRMVCRGTGHPTVVAEVRSQEAIQASRRRSLQRQIDRARANLVTAESDAAAGLRPQARAAARRRGEKAAALLAVLEAELAALPAEVHA